MPRDQMRSKLFTVEYCAMILLGLFNCLFGQSSLATLPVLMDSRGVSESIAAAVNMLFPLACLFFRRYAVKIGSMVSSKLSIFVCFVVLSVSNIFLDGISDVGWVIPIRIVQGLAICYIAGVIASLVAETVPSDRFDEGMGYFSIAIPVMSFFGPALCRILLANFGYSKMLRGLSALMLLPVAISLLTKMPNLKPVEREKTDKRDPFIEKRSIPASLLLMGSAMAATCTVSFLPLYAQRYALNHTLYFYMAAGIGVFGIRIAATIFKRSIPEQNSIPVSIVILTFVLLVLPVTNNPALSVIMGILYGMAIGLVQPYLITAALKSADPAHKSIATVTYYMFNDVGTVAGGMLWGYIAQYISYYAVFMAAAAINLFTLLGWLVLMKAKSVAVEAAGNHQH